MLLDDLLDVWGAPSYHGVNGNLFKVRPFKRHWTQAPLPVYNTVWNEWEFPLIWNISVNTGSFPPTSQIPQLFTNGGVMRTEQWENNTSQSWGARLDLWWDVVGKNDFTNFTFHGVADLEETLLRAVSAHHRVQTVSCERAGPPFFVVITHHTFL